MGRHTDRLRGETDPAVRARITRDAVLERRDQIRGKTIRRRGVTLTVDDIVPDVTATGTPFISVTVTITDAQGKNITPDNLNPIQIMNQPILVEDPAGDVIEGAGLRRYREDVQAALLATLERVMAQRVG
jgi:hypothetical protein